MAQTSWFPSQYQRSTGRIPVLCFPHAGGGTAIYHRWARSAPKSIQVVPICPPGREHRFSEPPHREWGPLVEELVELILSLLEPPIWLFGHSLGGLMAYQVATAIETGGPGWIQGLCASSCPAPSRLPRPTQRSQLADHELLASLIRDYGLTGNRAEQELEALRCMLPTVRADLELFESYIPTTERGLLPQVLVCGGDQDTMVRRDELEAWRPVARVRFATRTYPGGHFYYLQHGPSLLRWIDQSLEPSG